MSSARGPVLMGAPLHILRVWQWGDTEVVLRALGAARVGCGTYRCAGRLTPGWAGPQVGRQCAGRSARGSVCPDALTLTPNTGHRIQALVGGAWGSPGAASREGAGVLSEIPFPIPLLTFAISQKLSVGASSAVAEEVHSVALSLPPLWGCASDANTQCLGFYKRPLAVVRPAKWG